MRPAACESHDELVPMGDYNDNSSPKHQEQTGNRVVLQEWIYSLSLDSSSSMACLPCPNWPSFHRNVSGCKTCPTTAAAEQQPHCSWLTTRAISFLQFRSASP